jgi:UDP-N-acetylglucosamine pyrophosphorylase
MTRHCILEDLNPQHYCCENFNHCKFSLILCSYVYVNTIVCAAIERVLNQNSLNMEIIINNKSMDNGLNVIQLETAVGAAMKSFVGGLGE